MLKRDIIMQQISSCGIFYIMLKFISGDLMNVIKILFILIYYFEDMYC